MKRFVSDNRFDVSKLETVVAKPHSPVNRALARECKDVKIDRVYTGGKTEDFLAAAKVFLASGCELAALEEQLPTAGAGQHPRWWRRRRLAGGDVWLVTIRDGVVRDGLAGDSWRQLRFSD